jgi:GxxExxY protein
MDYEANSKLQYEINQTNENKKLEKENKKLKEKILKLEKKIESRKKRDDDLLAAKILRKANKGVKKLDVKLEWMEKDKDIIKKIINKCKIIYKNLLFSGKEGHYQMALEQELRLEGAHVLSELARPYHYKLSNGLDVQMPYNITCREDLVLPVCNMVLELKQTGKITEKEKNQLCRYMMERKNNTNWGEKVRGFLINFGDVDLDIYYACYSEGKINMVRVYNEKKVELKELINMYEL